MAGTVRIYRPEGSPYAFVDEEKLTGEMEVRGQFKQIREVLAKHVKDEVDRLTLSIDFGKVVGSIKSHGLSLSDDCRVYLFYLTRLAARENIKLNSIPKVERNTLLEATHEHLLYSIVYPYLGWNEEEYPSCETHEPPRKKVRSR